MVRNDIEGQCPINRPGHLGARTRKVKKLTAKSDWFKQKAKPNQETDVQGHSQKKGKGKRSTQPPETILIIPHTPNSDLKKILQKVDDQVMANTEFGRVKVIERLGSTLLQSLGNPAPWRVGHCG